MQSSLVSVVIPVFNAEKHIVKALDTVFQQSYRPIEIVIVDDGSWDETAQKIQIYLDEKCPEGKADGIEIQYFKQQNGGPSKARNCGIQKSRGELIAFLDADDLWNIKKIAKQVNLIQQYPSLDIIFTDARISRAEKKFNFFNSENIETDFFGPNPPFVENAVNKLLEINFIHTSSVLIKKSCFTKGFSFNEGRKYAEDWELWLKLSLSGFRFGFLSDTCITKNEDGRGLTSHQDRMLCSIADVLCGFWTENTKKQLTPSQARNGDRIVSLRYRWLAYHFFCSGQYSKAKDLYWKSFQTTKNVLRLGGWLKAAALSAITK